MDLKTILPFSFYKLKWPEEVSCFFCEVKFMVKGKQKERRPTAP